MGPARRDDRIHTYGDYLGWPEDVRYELIDGVAYLMAPAPSLVHQDVAGGIYAQLRAQLREGPCRAYIAPVDVRLPRSDEADEVIDTVDQPDVLVVCDPTRLDPRGVRGAPDFVVEVQSPSTASHDQVLKRRVYERAGVREYWLVHPFDRILTIYRLEGGSYGKPDVQELTGDTPIAVLADVAITWSEIVEQLPPREL
jgi:Uma2 family endonuclease